MVKLYIKDFGAILRRSLILSRRLVVHVKTNFQQMIKGSLHGDDVAS